LLRHFSARIQPNSAEKAADGTSTAMRHGATL
jgi:hypothetical protein